jgi:hypothetical protein
MAMATKTQRATCKAHCPSCGRHFGGDRAFDFHRAGDHADGTRHCVSPLDDPAQRLAGVADGWCEISGENDGGVPKTLHPVTVWSREYARGTGLSRHEAVSRRSEVERDRSPSLALARSA